MPKSDFEYTMDLIKKESENLYRLTRDVQPGLMTWCLAVGESIRKLNTYRIVQSQGDGHVDNG